MLIAVDDRPLIVGKLNALPHRAMRIIQDAINHRYSDGSQGHSR